jgi:hypothetical protein
VVEHLVARFRSTGRCLAGTFTNALINASPADRALCSSAALTSTVDRVLRFTSVETAERLTCADKQVAFPCRLAAGRDRGGPPTARLHVRRLFQSAVARPPPAAATPTVRPVRRFARHPPHALADSGSDRLNPSSRTARQRSRVVPAQIPRDDRLSTYLTSSASMNHNGPQLSDTPTSWASSSTPHVLLVPHGVVTFEIAP